MNNINFTGKFAINSSELSKISLVQKAKFLKQKNQLIDEFCKQGTTYSKTSNGYIFDIKADKENLFMQYIKKFGLNLDRID